MPGLAALQGVWPRPHWMMMKTGRRTFRPHTPLYAMWLGERRAAKANWPPSKWRPPGEVQHGSWLPEWISARRSLRLWRRSTPTGGHSGGCEWSPKVLGMRRSHGMNCSAHLHQGLRVRLRPWPSILWLCGGGTSRCEGRACACPLPPSSKLANLLTDEEAEGDVGEPHWFVTYSHALQRVGEVACRRKWEAWREALEITLMSSPISTSWLFASPPERHGIKWCGQPQWQIHMYPLKPSLMATVGTKWWISAP